MKVHLLALIRHITRLLERLSPPLAVRWASWLFFSPRTTQRQAPTVPNLQLSWCNYNKTTGKQNKVRVYRAGRGPAVLLLHGWEGAAFSHSELARHLLSEGFRVVLFDLPAHGLSPGRETNVVEVCDIIHKLAGEERQLHAIVGHSFGGACAGYAISQGLKVKHFVSVAAPPRVSFMISHFCALIGATTDTKAAITAQIDDLLKQAHEAASLTALAPFEQTEGLIIHDRSDRMIPYALAQEFAAAWPEAKFYSSDGLGHSRILQAPEIAKLIATRLLDD